jgi:O-antigen/teichoic acid export membrane protein
MAALIPAGEFPLRGSAIRLRVYERLAQFAGKGCLAVLDQGLFSGANFLTSIFLARWLAPADYGAYSLAFSVFLLFAAAHSALLNEPMMIFGASKYAARYSGYIRTLLRFHIAVLGPTSIVLCAIAGVLGRLYSPAVEHAFLALAAGSIFILAFWLLRQAPYVLLKPEWAVVASFLYCSVMTLAIWILNATGKLTGFAAFGAMAVASIAGVLIVLARFAGGFTNRVQRPMLGEVAIDHWRYGRWAIASAAVSWFPGQIYYTLLPTWIGLEGSAALRALFNFVMPVLQAIAALNLLLLPALVRDRRTGGHKKMTGTMLLFFAVSAVGCALFLTALWVFRGQLFQVFYGGRYGQYAGWPLIFAAALPLGTCATAVFGNAVRALERPDRVFWAYIGSALSTAVLGIPMAARFGVCGALAGIHISSFTLAFLLWRSYRSLATGESLREADTELRTTASMNARTHAPIRELA